MTEMIDRLALAIHEGLGGDGWAYINYGADELNDCHEELVNAVKAVIAGLREPTKGMKAAAARVARERWCTVSARPGDVEIEMLWQAMMDTLLKDLTNGKITE